jgi:hypothetical protein
MLVRQSVQGNLLRPCSGFVQVHSGLSGLARSSSSGQFTDRSRNTSVLHRDGAAAALMGAGSRVELPAALCTTVDNTET